MKIKQKLTAIVTGLLFLNSASSHAGLITKNILGEVTFVDSGFSANFDANTGDMITGYFSYDDSLLSNSGLEFIPFLDLNISIGNESVTELGNSDPLQGLEFFNGTFDGFLFDLVSSTASEDFSVFGGPGLTLDIADENYNFLNAEFSLSLGTMMVPVPNMEVPEPGPLSLLALGASLLAFSRRKHVKKFDR